MADEKATEKKEIRVVQITDWTNSIECPICSSTKLEQFCANIQEYRPTTRWAICGNCTHVFVNPRPSDAWSEAFYTEGYRTMTYSLEKEDSKAIPRISAEEELSRAIHVINNIIRWRGEDTVANHLDIGSSTGALLASTMERFGCKVLTGVEPGRAWRDFSVQSYKVFAKRLGQENKLASKDAVDPIFTVYPTIDKVPKTPKFDLITVIHTLEHLNDPRVVLEKAILRMRPKGMLIIMVPYLLGGFVDPLMFPHLHSFTRETLKTIIETVGLEMVFYENGGGVSAPFWPPPVDLFAIAMKPGAVTEIDKSRLLELYVNARLVDRKVKDAMRQVKPQYEMG